MIRGSCMESPSGSGRDGIRIRDFTLPVRELRLASALESVSLVVLAGAGTTGATTGITMTFVSTTTTTNPTAECSSIVVTSITRVHFTGPAALMAEGEHSPAGSMDLHHTASPAGTPARLAALILQELREASPLADDRVLSEAFTQ